MRDTVELRISIALGVLLVADIAAHAHFLLTGQQSFWITVTLIMAAFCLVSSRMLLGHRATFIFLGVGVALGFFFEALSIRTGFPFGPYYYTAVFGPQVMGVPLIIPIAWYVIVYLGYVLANLIIDQQPVVTGGTAHAILMSLMGAAIVTAFDLAADPFMVREVGAWVMTNPGSYFGEQIRGFFGWTLVSFLIAFIVRVSHRYVPPRPVRRVTPVAAAYPLLAYGVWWLFFSFAGAPQGIKAVALYAMGIPVLAAASGLARWTKAVHAAQAAGAS